LSSGADRRRGPHAVLGPALLADDPVALRTYRGAVSRVVPTRLVATRLGDLLEALEVTLHAAVDHAERGADVLEEALGVVLDVEVHLRRVLVDLVERHLAGVARTGHALPGDARVRLFRRDAGFPLLFPAADVRPPVEAVAALAAYLLHTFHEGWEALELAEEPVGLGDRNVHVDRLVE